jgi:protein-L-isoaspartate O-methyltransferase
MILPIGMSKDEQTLIKVRKEKSKIHYEEIFKVRFVPLLEGLPKIGNYING